MSTPHLAWLALQMILRVTLTTCRSRSCTTCPKQGRLPLHWIACTLPWSLSPRGGSQSCWRPGPAPVRWCTQRVRLAPEGTCRCPKSAGCVSPRRKQPGCAGRASSSPAADLNTTPSCLSCGLLQQGQQAEAVLQAVRAFTGSMLPCRLQDPSALHGMCERLQCH